MATNTYFNSYRHPNEQRLIDDLVIESIKIYGLDMTYVTRSLQEVDHIMNEDDLSIFNRAYNVEMYVKSVDGFQGEGDFLSKFGLTIRDQAVFTVAIRSFEKHVIDSDETKKRPNEGDLIFLPLNNKFYKIMHVEHESVFYQMGALQVYDLKCELFEYSNERFETGNEIIDSYFETEDTTTKTSIADLYTTDKIAKNTFYQDEANNVLDFSEINPFEEIISYPTD